MESMLDVDACLPAELCGATITKIAAGLDATPSLGAFYQRVFSGALDIASGDGQWWFGLALTKTSLTL